MGEEGGAHPVGFFAVAFGADLEGVVDAHQELAMGWWSGGSEVGVAVVVEEITEVFSGL